MKDQKIIDFLTLKYSLKKSENVTEFCEKNKVGWFAFSKDYIVIRLKPLGSKDEHMYVVKKNSIYRVTETINDD